MSQSKVTFVAICYGEQYEVYMFIGMLLCQKNPNWETLIYHDGPNPWLKAVVESFKDPRIQYREEEANSGSWGCFNRIRAINSISTDFIVQCTLQEYYVPVAVDHILKAGELNDFIYWPTIHHSADYNIIPGEPRVKHIDWSNFAMKTWIAKKVGIKQPTDYCADGLFVEDVMGSGYIKSLIRIPKVLSVKN